MLSVTEKLRLGVSHLLLQFPSLQYECIYETTIEFKADMILLHVIVNISLYIAVQLQHSLMCIQENSIIVYF
jgi:hypothetical protein